jgi:putative FmdB family regulatory protein
MPIFEYDCQDCGNAFETLVRSGTSPTCPLCHSIQLEKKLSVFATASGSADAAASQPGPCGTCGHPNGPGSCRLN